MNSLKADRQFSGHNEIEGQQEWRLKQPKIYCRRSRRAENSWSVVQMMSKTAYRSCLIGFSGSTHFQVHRRDSACQISSSSLSHWGRWISPLMLNSWPCSPWSRAVLCSGRSRQTRCWSLHLSDRGVRTLFCLSQYGASWPQNWGRPLKRSSRTAIEDFLQYWLHCFQAPPQ